MPYFETKCLPAVADVRAPDGSDVRILLQLPGGSLAHFSLPPWGVSVAVRHATVSEMWYFISGVGQLWRAQEDHAEVIAVGPGVAISIPKGTAFQFRSTRDEALVAVAITMPPWPGEGEATFVPGEWSPTVAPGCP